MSSNNKQVKAVGLLSGGLDSILAAKVIKDLGVEVHGIHFLMPWDSEQTSIASKAAEQIGIRFADIQLDDQYLTMLKNPKCGYGKAFNPCIDCHAYMIRQAAAYMHKIDAAFVFTGEVLGQRPMSQNPQSLKKVEKDSGLQGRLIRPLSALLLDPSIPEQEGLIDRSKLLNLNGRSRQEQFRLAQDFQITKFRQPAGGCLLTDKNFGHRIEDFLEHPYHDFRETIVLKWGRHFRINHDFKVIVSRDEKEGDLLLKYARSDNWAMILNDEEKLGPLVLLQGKEPSQEVLSVAGGLVQRFSRYRDDAPLTVKYWRICDPDRVQVVTALTLELSQIKAIQI